LTTQVSPDNAHRHLPRRRQLHHLLPIDYLRDNKILMAYRMNEVVIPAERGFPFMLVAESKWGYKWAKWITAVEVSDDVSYKGYWEQRGYSNDGDLGSDFVE
jgi:DMSO/TMAO reductase YedYZ molybdopterin-dependent catalytic subunit